MPTPVMLPEGYHYVAGALVSSIWLIVWQALVVSRHRRRSGITYPQLYAEKAEAEASHEAHLFNCAQRAHQNTLEHMPVMLISTLVSGLRYPVFAAGAYMLWVFSRVLYTVGYTTGDPAKRNTRGGILGDIPLLGLILGSTFVAYRLFVDA